MKLSKSSISCALFPFWKNQAWPTLANLRLVRKSEFSTALKQVVGSFWYDLHP